MLRWSVVVERRRQVFQAQMMIRMDRCRMMVGDMAMVEVQ